MAKKPQKRAVPLPKPVIAWAGVSDGKLHCWGGETRYYEIYPTRAQAKIAYEHFVRVKIIPERQRK